MLKRNLKGFATAFFSLVSVIDSQYIGDKKFLKEKWNFPVSFTEHFLQPRETGQIFSLL